MLAGPLRGVLRPLGPRRQRSSKESARGARKIRAKRAVAAGPHDTGRACHTGSNKAHPRAKDSACRACRSPGGSLRPGSGVGRYSQSARSLAAENADFDRRNSARNHGSPAGCSGSCNSSGPGSHTGSGGCACPRCGRSARSDASARHTCWRGPRDHRQSARSLAAKDADFDWRNSSRNYGSPAGSFGTRSFSRPGSHTGSRGRA